MNSRQAHGGKYRADFKKMPDVLVKFLNIFVTSHWDLGKRVCFLLATGIYILCMYARSSRLV